MATSIGGPIYEGRAAEPLELIHEPVPHSSDAKPFRFRGRAGHQIDSSSETSHQGNGNGSGAATLLLTTTDEQRLNLGLTAMSRVQGAHALGPINLVRGQGHE